MTKIASERNIIFHLESEQDLEKIKVRDFVPEKGNPQYTEPALSLICLVLLPPSFIKSKLFIEAHHL